MASAGLKLHVAVSNQHRGVDDATIIVRVDGRVVSRASLAFGSQHGWQESVVDAERGDHAVEVEETTSGTTGRQQFTADGDRWIVVMFEGPPPSLAIHVMDREVGFL